jgi:hypothetical protein
MIVSFGVAKDAAAQRKVDFRFGSLADICTAIGHVRFTPNADMCRATRDVRFGPKADLLSLFDDLVGAADQ